MTTIIQIECATVNELLSYIDEVKDFVKDKKDSQPPLYSLKTHPEGNWAIEINNNK